MDHEDAPLPRDRIPVSPQSPVSGTDVLQQYLSGVNNLAAYIRELEEERDTNQEIIRQSQARLSELEPEVKR